MNSGLDGFPSPKPSEIWLGTVVGYSGINTSIPYYAQLLKQIGNAMAVINSPAYGAGVLIGEPGLYFVQLTHVFTASAYGGLTVNATPAQLSTVITSVPQPTKLASGRGAVADAPFECCSLGRFDAGDIIRPHLSATAVSGALAADCQFKVTKLQ